MISSLSRLCCSRLRLPYQRHIPGSQSIAELDYLSAIIQRMPATISSDRWRGNLPYRYGWYLFTNQYYWEAHEVWEAVWMRADINSRERFLIQGLIQLSNAGLKVHQKKDSAAAKIMTLAMRWLEAAYPPNSDMSGAPLMGASKASIQQLFLKMHY